MAGKKKTTAGKKPCTVTKRCSTYGRKLKNEHSTPAGRGLNTLCKPQKKARKKAGCLSGTASKSYVEVVVRIPKSKLSKLK
jgi:hypothetical protein